MALGSFIYVVASAFGLAAIFLYLPWVYTLVKLTGAGFLIYLANHCLNLTQSDNHQTKLLTKLSNRLIFKQSLVVELTNPKTALFFIAFLPLFVEPQLGNITLQLLILGAIYSLIGLLSDLCVATLSGKIGLWMNTHPSSEKWQHRFSGLLLFAMGGFIVFAEVMIFLDSHSAELFKALTRREQWAY
jgi:threonine/homoserine/homoserine lactone efflux protein